LRVQIYQSDWRLQLLFTFAVANVMDESEQLLAGWADEIPYCRSADILLQMDDHDLHLVDQDALDLRHACLGNWNCVGMDIISLQVDGDSYNSAALHCMHFLFHPP